MEKVITIVLVAEMTKDEARVCVDAINAHINGARRLILELYERNGWTSLGYGSWRECVVAEFNQSQAYLYQQLEAGRAERNISAMAEIGTIPERQLRPLTSLEPDQQREVWQKAVETAPEGRITAAHVQRVADEITKRPVSYHISDDSYEWYTPAEYIDAAREVLGEIDLDPASSEMAQTVIGANRFYTKEQDGLLREWKGRVWLNPPYNMPLIEQFIDKVITEYEAGNVTAAMILTNNSTDTGWFHKLILYPVCFTRGRIHFWNPEIEDGLATRQGQALFYLGKKAKLFAKVFTRFGAVMVRYDYQ